MKQKVEEFVVNGAKVAIYPMSSVRSVIAMIGFRAGAWYETPGNLGSTHFMEHMFFEGVEGMPTRELIEEHNEQFGIYANATTSRRRMWFETRFPDVNLRYGLGMMSKFVNEPLFPELQLTKEKNIVKQEHMDMVSRPEYRYGRKIDEMLNGKNHVFNQIPIGNMEEVEPLTRQDLHEMYDKVIVPQNMFISMAGNIKVEEAKAMLEDLTSRRSGVEATRDFEPPHPTEKKVVHIEPKTDAAKVNWFWQTPGEEVYGMKERVRFNLAMYLLGGSPRSLLYNRLREELGIAYRVSASWPVGPMVGELEVGTSIDPKNIDLADEEVKKVIKKFVANPIPEREFQRAVDFLNWQSLMSYDSVGRIADGLFDLLMFEDRIYTPDDFIAMRNEIKENQVREAVSIATSGIEPFMAIMRKE